MERCSWSNTIDLYINYHDSEWGIPVHDDRLLFEYLFLEVFQCGLSWLLILQKRETFRECFDDFDFNKIAKYNQDDVRRIMSKENMIHSERKIKAIINNAQCFQQIIKEFGSFSCYLWAFSDNKTIIYEGHGNGVLPVSNGLSDKISQDLKKRGFKYLGSTTIYSYLQSCGIINDHEYSCPQYRLIIEKFPVANQPRNNDIFK